MKYKVIEVKLENGAIVELPNLMSPQPSAVLVGCREEWEDGPEPYLIAIYLVPVEEESLGAGPKGSPGVLPYGKKEVQNG